MTSDSLPRYGAEEIADALDAADPFDATVVGVILAGGLSSRFGEANKLLADIDGEPLVRHATRTLLEAELDEVVVVVGHEAEAVTNALAGLDVRIVENTDYAAGLSTTVKRGVGAARDADAIVFVPGDMPEVHPTTVDRLVDAYLAGLGTALAAAYDGRRGNPVLFGHEHFDDLLDVEGDVGGRSVLVESNHAALVETVDAGVVYDIDTVDDL